MRKLASIQKIALISPIQGADRIEVASILGWECVVSKADNFKPGDLCVYFEIDSILPSNNPAFTFMEARHYRIKTIRLKKQVSQGLVMPLSILPNNLSVSEGLDVTELLGVTKHETDDSVDSIDSKAKKHGKLFKFMLRFAFIRRIIKHLNKSVSWPAWVSKTDEDRIQIKPSILERFKNEVFYVTEKVDYQSASFFIRGHKFLGLFNHRVFGVCSRNVWRKHKNLASQFWKIAEKYRIEEILRFYKDDLTIQGELGDINIQKNKYELMGPEFWVFNIINNKTGYHFDLNEMLAFCDKHGLKFVPVLDCNFKLKNTTKEMVEYSRGKSVINPKIQREGVVIRLIKDGEKLQSFKVINPDFLLKYDNGSEK